LVCKKKVLGTGSKGNQGTSKKVQVTYMEIINKKSLVIKNGSLRSKQRQYITVTTRGIYFTAAISRMCELKEGEFMHFMNEGDKWDFFTNDDSDGFAITPVTSKKGFNINSSALASLIRKSTGYIHNKMYEVLPTGRVYDKCPVFEIKTHQTEKGK
jgi:phage pi2 protein 07